MGSEMCVLVEIYSYSICVLRRTSYILLSQSSIWANERRRRFDMVYLKKWKHLLTLLVLFCRINILYCTWPRLTIAFSSTWSFTFILMNKITTAVCKRFWFTARRHNALHQLHTSSAYQTSCHRLALTHLPSDYQ